MGKVKSINLVNGVGALSIMKSAGMFEAVETLTAGGQGALASSIKQVADSALNPVNQAQAIGTIAGVLGIKMLTKGKKVVGKIGGLQFTA